MRLTVDRRPPIPEPTNKFFSRPLFILITDKHEAQTHLAETRRQFLIDS